MTLLNLSSTTTYEKVRVEKNRKKKTSTGICKISRKLCTSFYCFIIASFCSCSSQREFLRFLETISKKKTQLLITIITIMMCCYFNRQTIQQRQTRVSALLEWNNAENGSSMHKKQHKYCILDFFLIFLPFFSFFFCIFFSVECEMK